MLDAESTDATAALARARGAQVEVRRGAATSTRAGTRSGASRRRYAFMLDADETLDDGAGRRAERRSGRATTVIASTG